MPEWINSREFARRVGVSAASVYSAIDAGRIYRHPETKLIDWETQEAAWKKNRNPNHSNPSQDPYNRRGGQEGFSAQSVGSAKIQQAHFQAKLKELEYNKKKGEVLDKRFIKLVIFKFGRQVRDSVLTIPERVGAVYAAEVMDKVRAVLLKKLPSDKVDEVLLGIDQKDFELIARKVWSRESKSVLEALDGDLKLEGRVEQ